MNVNHFMGAADFLLPWGDSKLKLDQRDAWMLKPWFSDTVDTAETTILQQTMHGYDYRFRPGMNSQLIT